MTGQQQQQPPSQQQQQQPAPPPPNPPAQVQVRQPIFVLTPGQYHLDLFIDYSTAQGIVLWNAATKSLLMEFNAGSDRVKQFCELLMQWATKSGWSARNGDILTIPDSDGVNHNLLLHYGRLTLADIQAHVYGYIQG